MEPTRHLFEPLRLGGRALANWTAASPMCQYRVEDGGANDWYLQHLGSLSPLGAVLVVAEQTAVEPTSPHHSRLPRPLFERERDGAGAYCRLLPARGLGGARDSACPCRCKGSAKLPWRVPLATRSKRPVGNAMQAVGMIVARTKQKR